MAALGDVGFFIFAFLMRQLKVMSNFSVSKFVSHLKVMSGPVIVLDVGYSIHILPMDGYGTIFSYNLLGYPLKESNQ